MQNLKDETLKHLERHSKTVEDIDYCHIHNDSYFDDEKQDYCKGEFNPDALNFNYDSGFGGQEVNGFIVYKDGTWSERGEYDGSEWWEYKSKPTLPKEEEGAK